MKNNIKYIRDVLILLLLVTADQFTKLLVQRDLASGEDVILIDGVLRFTYHENNGAVWGIFQDGNFWLMIFSSLMIMLLIWFYIRTPKVKFYAPLRVFTVLIMAGALGNLVDRIRDGYVIDFVYFELINFPIFNLADCYITITCFFAIVFSFIRYRNEEFSFLSIRKKDKSSESADEEKLSDSDIMSENTRDTEDKTEGQSDDCVEGDADTEKTDGNEA